MEFPSVSRSIASSLGQAIAAQDATSPSQLHVGSITQHGGTAFYGSTINLSGPIDKPCNEEDHISKDLYDMQSHYNTDSMALLHDIQSGMHHLQFTQTSAQSVLARLNQMELALSSRQRVATQRKSKSHPRKKPTRRVLHAPQSKPETNLHTPSIDYPEMIRIVRAASLAYEMRGRLTQQWTAITDPDYEHCTASQRVSMIRQIQALRMLIWLLQKSPQVSGNLQSLIRSQRPSMSLLNGIMSSRDFALRWQGTYDVDRGRFEFRMWMPYCPVDKAKKYFMGYLGLTHGHPVLDIIHRDDFDCLHNCDHERETDATAKLDALISRPDLDPALKAILSRLARESKYRARAEHSPKVQALILDVSICRTAHDELEEMD